MPLITICIPSYKRVEFLKRLLDSIHSQTFKDFEVIITDDTPDDTVYNLSKQYQDKFAVSYFKNPAPLGPPANWNEAIRQAKGEWIKLMHDDDWFADNNSLSEFANAARHNPSFSFFYSAYTNIFESGKEKSVYANSFRRKKLLQNPVTLFSKNIIGPPSVTLLRNDRRIWYDPNVKWVVDIDFYIQYLKDVPSFYIDSTLIKVGIHHDQVTQQSFRVPTVELPENFYLLNKVGVGSLKEILVYDAWWRLLRNMRITSLAKIREAGYRGDVPHAVESMIAWQSNIPIQILKVGAFSKLIMFVHYLFNRSRLS